MDSHLSCQRRGLAELEKPGARAQFVPTERLKGLRTVGNAVELLEDA